MLFKFSSVLYFSKYHYYSRRTELLVLFFVFLEPMPSLKLFISSSVYSYFEKGCQRKCTRQSRKVLWVVLSSLLFKESQDRMAREAMDECLQVLKESNESRFDSYSVGEQCIDHIPYYLPRLSRADFFRQPFSK